MCTCVGACDCAGVDACAGVVPAAAGRRPAIGRTSLPTLGPAETSRSTLAAVFQGLKIYTYIHVYINGYSVNTVNIMRFSLPSF